MYQCHRNNIQWVLQAKPRNTSGTNKYLYLNLRKTKTKFTWNYFLKQLPTDMEAIIKKKIYKH